MNINATLIGQTIAFAVFVWFCMKFIWPPIVGALNERKTRIADGLAAAEEGRREKAEAEQSATKTLDEAKDQAKVVARTEGERILATARGEINKEVNQAREELRQQVAKLAVAGASQILTREVDASAHSKMLDELAKEL